MINFKGVKMKNKKVLASSSSLEGITKLISSYFFGSTITLNEISNNIYSVSNKIKLLENYEVIKRKNKYQFKEK